jgi:AcrR family transcriptional regulator
MGVGKPTSVSRMSREAWVEAAIEAIGAGGIEAVAVEPIAIALGVTKGSFYWHFKNRSELLQATLEQWEARATAQTIEHLSTISDPAARLRMLLETALASANEDSGEVAILAAVNDPIVGPAVQRVHAARIAFLESIFSELGLTPARSRIRARIAYSAYLGHLTLQVSDGFAPTTTRAMNSYVDEFTDVLLP